MWVGWNTQTDWQTNSLYKLECCCNVVHYIMISQVFYILTVAKNKSAFELTKENPYLALMGELQGAFCKDLGKKRPCYNGIVLYVAQ